MDPKEQLRQVEAEIAKDEAEAKRWSRTDAAGARQWGRNSYQKDPPIQENSLQG